MIIVGAKNTGKKLVNGMVRALQKEGTIQVAALSDRGVQQLNSACQKASNKLGIRIHANPSEGEVFLDGSYRVALIVTLSTMGVS